MSIPTNLRVPFMAVEFDASRAYQGASTLQYKCLAIGQKISSGTAIANTFVKVTKDTPDLFFGAGSDLAIMCAAFFANNKFTDLYAYAYADPSGDAAVGKLSFTGPSTASGEISLLIGGKHISTTIGSAAAATVIATAVAAAINAEEGCQVTAAVNGTNAYEVDITCKNIGIIGNSIITLLNYYEGEALPAGVGLTITQLTGGTGSIDVDTVIAALGDEWYQIIFGSFKDSSNLSAMDTELADRFGPLVMKDGSYLFSYRGTGGSKAVRLQDTIDFGSALNSKHFSCINSTDIPNTPNEVAAAYAGQIAYEGSVHPALPFQTLELVGILPPVVGNRLRIEENNSLLFDGIATFEVSGNKVLIQRAITTYQTNTSGTPDIAYLDMNTMLTLLYLRYDFRNRIRTKYPRALLANDGVRVKPGLQVMTPSVGKAEAINIFRTWEFDGLVEGIDQFKRDLICQRSTSDVNRIEWVLPPDLMNQFMIGAASMQFLLNSNS